MQLRALLAGAGALVALTGCGAGTTLVAHPAAATSSATSAGQGTAARACEAAPWTGSPDPQGRPRGFDAGDVGAVYIWHDRLGWHLRATDMRATDHHYTGTVALSPGASFLGLRPVRDEQHDRVWVDGSDVLHYDFHTYASIDGVDFLVSCPAGGREREQLLFHTEYDGQPVAERVRIGASKAIPPAATFRFVRSL
ncbi:MAG TPA: hypothetical protein VKY90_02935 [Candidatus Dormibacteraeota bacterium]|nr:hypothetical protein [Candidatus Dormibacteraeota bacterium]